MDKSNSDSLPGVYLEANEKKPVIGSSVGKESACSAGDPGLIPGLGRSPGEENGNPLQYPGKSHGQRSLVDCSPWRQSMALQELDTTTTTTLL